MISYPDDRLIKAATNWWRMKRPCGWTKDRHLKTPTVNCVGDDERTLAKSVADFLIAEKVAP